MNTSNDNHNDDLMDINPLPLELDDATQNQVTKSSALYLLKLQEECYLPKSTVKSVLENTKSIVQETLSVVKTQVEECLANNDVDQQSVAGFGSIFEENNIATNPFHNLETETQQNKYYKDNFQLKVCIYIKCLLQPEPFYRGNAIHRDWRECKSLMSWAFILVSIWS